MFARLHHAHLLCSDVEATIAFWRDAFDAEVVADIEAAGARNVFVAVGDGRLHLYDQPPADTGRGAVHHLGLQVDDLEQAATRAAAAGASVGTLRRHQHFDYAMASGPDGILIEMFRPHLAALPAGLARFFDTSPASSRGPTPAAGL